MMPRILPKEMTRLARSIWTQSALQNKVQYNLKPEWKVAVKEAEVVVGYPSSFLNLRWLLNDEIANIVIHLKKLIGTNHPLLKTAREFLFKNELPAWGLVVLLVSKAGGLKMQIMDIDHDKTAGILHSQRVLAEVTEMIRTSILIHTGLVNVRPTDEFASDLNFGNKIALLSGDYLLSKCFNDIANVKNQKVNELISSTLRDFVECEFLDPRDEQNFPLPAQPSNIPSTDISNSNNNNLGPYKVGEILGNSRDEWFLRSILGGANLLGKTCRAALLLAGHNEASQNLGYLFGKNLALAWQVKTDCDLIKESRFSLVSAPVMLHLEKDPALYKEIKKGLKNVENCDFNKIRSIVMSGSGMNEAKDLQMELADRALENLKGFDDCVAKEALRNIINAM